MEALNIQQDRHDTQYACSCEIERRHDELRMDGWTDICGRLELGDLKDSRL